MFIVMTDCRLNGSRIHFTTQNRKRNILMISRVTVYCVFNGESDLLQEPVRYQITTGGKGLGKGELFVFEQLYRVDFTFHPAYDGAGIGVPAVSIDKLNKRNDICVFSAQFNVGQRPRLSK